MVRYFTSEFFEALVASLNQDEEWRRRARRLNLKILLNVTDRGEVHLLQITEGTLSTRGAKPEDPADFELEGTYDNWAAFATGENDLPALVMTGRLRFKGSVSKIMALQDALNRLAQIARSLSSR